MGCRTFRGCVGICGVDTGIDPAHEQIAPRTVVFKDFVGTRTTPYDDHGHGTHVMSIAAGDGTGGGSAATFRGVAPAADLYAAKVLNSSGSGSDSAVVAGIQWCQAEMSLDLPNGVDLISLSSDANGDPLSYVWSEGGVGTGVTLSLKRFVGSYTFVVTVADNHGGSDSDDVTIVVRAR